MRRLSALAIVLALVTGGCAMFADPVVSTEDEALDALLALRDGAELRARAALELDEDEVRRVLRDDAEARALLARSLDDTGEDVDDLVTALEEAGRRLSEHAVLLATGGDGSARIAAEHDGAVWLDLRVGGLRDAGADAEPARIDLQAQVDWDVLAELADEPGLLEQLDEAAEEFLELVGEAPELGAVRDLVLGLLAGELVGIGGELDPDLLTELGMDELAPAADAGPMDAFGDPRDLAATALSFDGFRRDGDETVVDVSIEVRALAEAVLDAAAENPDRVGATFEDVQSARAELDQLPEVLTDVAVLRFDGEGVLRQVRVDLLDLALQAARASDDVDEDLAVAERVAGELDATGLFVVVDVERVGAPESVLGEPTVTASPEDLAAAVGALFLGGLGLELPPGALPPGGPSSDGEDPAPGADDTAAPGTEDSADGLTPGQLAVGDCFDDTALFGIGEVATVPCTQPHDNEAFGQVTLDDDATYEEVERNEPDAVACIELFEAYVGVAYARSELLVDVLRPDAAAFEAGRRTSVCYLYGAEPLTGSMAGTGR